MENTRATSSSSESAADHAAHTRESDTNDDDNNDGQTQGDLPMGGVFYDWGGDGEIGLHHEEGSNAAAGVVVDGSTLWYSTKSGLCLLW